MTDHQRIIRYYTLMILEEFKRTKQKGFERTIQSILKGVEGPNASKFKHLQAYGKVPNLNKTEFNTVVEALYSDKEITFIENQYNHKRYIYKFSNVDIPDIKRFDKLFGIEQKPYEVPNFDLIGQFESQRSMSDSTASSQREDFQVATLYGLTETFTESGLEKAFVKELEYIDYIKIIIHQPITITLPNSSRKYTSDFFIQTYDNHLLLVEIKDFKEIIIDQVRKKHDALVTYFKEYPIQIKLITHYKDQWISLEDILNRQLNLDLNSKINQHIKKTGCLTSDEAKKITQDLELENLDLFKVILNNKYSCKGKHGNYTLYLK